MKILAAIFTLFPVDLMLNALVGFQSSTFTLAHTVDLQSSGDLCIQILVLPFAVTLLTLI